MIVATMLSKDLCVMPAIRIGIGIKRTWEIWAREKSERKVYCRVAHNAERYDHNEVWNIMQKS